jgi:hypothetical protein
VYVRVNVYMARVRVNVYMASVRVNVYMASVRERLNVRERKRGRCGCVNVDICISCGDCLMNVTHHEHLCAYIFTVCASPGSKGTFSACARSQS